MCRRHASRQSGFTLLEVLVSMVIIAFGLLGVAGLQAFALKNNQSATYRSIATTLAGDMSDRMRANYFGAGFDFQYNQPTLAGYATSVAACATPTGCTSGQLAQNDLYEWQQRIATSLPGGVGIVCVDSTPHDGANGANPACDGNGITNYVVKIWWTDDRTRTGNAAVPQRFSTTINP